MDIILLYQNQAGTSPYPNTHVLAHRKRPLPRQEKVFSAILQKWNFRVTIVEKGTLKSKLKLPKIKSTDDFKQQQLKFNP